MMLLSVTLLLTSCAASEGLRNPIPRPSLQSATVNNHGGICLDRQDTAELLHYLDALEDN
jgi:hypothetical protein